MWSEQYLQPAYVASPTDVRAVMMHFVEDGDFAGTYYFDQVKVILWKMFIPEDADYPQEWGLILYQGKPEYAEVTDEFLGYVYAGVDAESIHLQFEEKIKRREANHRQPKT